MINRLACLLFVVLVLCWAGCTDNQSDWKDNLGNEGKTFSLDITLNVADISAVQSRAFSESPDYEGLKLYILEFDKKGNPLSNPLSNDLTGSIKEPSLNSDGDIHFKLTLNKTSESKVLHFIALPQDVALNLSLEGGNFTEGTLIPALQVSNSTPAYWQRVEFPLGYGSFDVSNNWTPATYLEEKLSHVPMIRNFAKISLAAADGKEFTIEGFALVNQPTKGTVAPWNPETGSFPSFLDGENKMQEYATIDAAYEGYWPFDPVTDVGNKTPVEADFTPASKYLYERPMSSVNNLYIIVKVKRAANGPSMYYKLDLGKPTNTTPFEYYDILRNFEYAVTIGDVEADGYATIGDAMNGVVFNNLSFDVNTRQMLNVSNGHAMLWVNQATFVVTNDGETTIHFKYRYKTDINNNGGTVSNGALKFPGLEPGDAIESVTHGTTDDADGWREVTIITKNPTPTRVSQEFIIYDPNTGLGRTINIIVRNPWNYMDPALYGVVYDTYDQYKTARDSHGDWANNVSSTSAGQPVTVSFKIDDNIPEAMFPLEFVFEANPQNIENNKTGNLLVKTEASYFGSVNQPTIKYVKTVTWADYNSELSEDNPTGTKVTDGGSTFHFVRARFLTIQSVSGTTNRLRVYNPYMRVQGGTNDYLDFTYSAKDEEGPDLTTTQTP